jgi:SAUR family protein
MAPSKKLTKFLSKVLHVSLPRHKASFSRHSSATTNSFDASSLGINSGRSWGSMGDIHNGSHGGFHGYDSDVECSSPPADVPAGCLAVYVGKERRRFVIPTSYLSNSVFRALLAKSEEEFGFCCDGGLRIACAPDVFEHLLWWLEGATPEVGETEVVGQPAGSL